MIHKKIIALTAAACLMAVPFISSAADNPPSLTVSGTGTVTAPADTATLYVIVETTSPEAAAAAQDNAAISTKVWNAALAAGAKDQGITTTGYNLWPETSGQNKNKTTYHVQNSMKITVKDLSRTGAVSDAALKAGATRIGSVSFTLEDTTPYKERALTEAVNDARQKANSIAVGLGCTITGVRSVSVGDINTNAPRARMLLNTAGGAADTETTLTPGTQSIMGQVTIVFDIA